MKARKAASVRVKPKAVSDAKSAEKPVRTILFVLGMHRSGTSVLAGVLAKLGVTPPLDLMPPADQNPLGFFESLGIARFNDDLLATAGSKWDDWLPFDSRWYESPLCARMAAESGDVFLDSFGTAELVALKDPRICRFVKFWTDAVQGLNAVPKVLMPLRAPLEVAHSLRKRDGFSLEKGLLLWLRHVLDAEYATRSLPRSLFALDDFLAGWQAVSQRAFTEIGLGFPLLDQREIMEIDNFVVVDFRRRYGQADPCIATPIFGLANKTFALLTELSLNSASASAQNGLDEIRRQFDQACHLLGAAVRENESALQTIAGRERSVIKDRMRLQMQLGAAQSALEKSTEENARLVEVTANRLSEMAIETAHLVAAAQSKSS